MSKEYDNWKNSFIEKNKDNISANDLSELDSIVDGLESENTRLTDENKDLSDKNVRLKNDNWDLYKKLPREDTKPKEDEKKTMSYDDLFAKK